MSEDLHAIPPAPVLRFSDPTERGTGAFLLRELKDWTVVPLHDLPPGRPTRLVRSSVRPGPRGPRRCGGRVSRRRRFSLVAARGGLAPAGDLHRANGGWMVWRGPVAKGLSDRASDCVRRHCVKGVC